MSTEKEIRPTANGTDKGIAGNSTTSIVTAGIATTAEPAVKIGGSVESSLAAALARLLADEISLDDLTASLAGFYLAGHAAALASTLPELTRVEQERDRAQADATRYYNAAFSPRQSVNIGPSYAQLEQIRAEMYSGGAA